MIKTTICTATIMAFLAIAGPVSAQKQGTTNGSKTDVKFLEDIAVTPGTTQPSAQPAAEPTGGSARVRAELVQAARKENFSFTSSIEEASKLQIKYAILLDTEVETVQNLGLCKLIDEWLGTRYQLGGSTKAGIDCSAFTQILLSTAFNITLPRTAKEQYNLSQRISRTELKEGDLVFFNTAGGVSHVGMYLQNNKFVHASSSGVIISDLYEDYWMKRLVGAGRFGEVVVENAVSVSRL